VFITLKSYTIRVYASDYKSFDMGVDGLILEYLCYSLIYGAYLQLNGFNFDQLLYGTIVGVLNMFGKQMTCIAYSEGPGGPINTILMT